MRRVCNACHKEYFPNVTSGGILAKNYQICPYCRSEDTGAKVGSMSRAPKNRVPPPSSVSFGFNNRKPPTH